MVEPEEEKVRNFRKEQHFWRKLEAGDSPWFQTIDIFDSGFFKTIALSIVSIVFLLNYR